MRQPLPDLLKGLAVIFMIQVHIMELFATQHIYDSWIGRTALFAGGPPAAPVFMVVMGYFIGLSQKSFNQHIMRGLKLIGIGFLLNIGLNMHLFLRIMAGALDLNPWDYIFGVDILFLAGFSVIIIALIRKKSLDYIWIPVILGLGVTLLSDLLPDKLVNGGAQRYLMALFHGNYSWSYFPLIPWLAYPLTGFILASINNRWPTIHDLPAKTRAILRIAAIIVIVTAFSWALRVSGNLAHYYHHGILFFLWVIVFLLLWQDINEFCVNKWNHNLAIRYIRWVGKNVTPFYIIQWLLIGNIATGIYKSQGILNIGLWFFGILLLTSLLVFTWEKRRLLSRNHLR